MSQVGRVGDELRFEYGKPLPREGRDENGAFAVYGANGIKSRCDHYLCDQPGIVVCRKGSAGEITLTEDCFWPLDVTYFVEFNRSRHDLRYLFHLLSWLNLPRFAKGVKPGINREDVYALHAPFPPLAEQHRIVTILDKTLQGIAVAAGNVQRNLANALALQRSCLEYHISSSSATYPMFRLSDLCASDRDITYGVVKLGDPKIDGVPCLRTSNVRWLKIDSQGVKLIAPSLSNEYKRTILRGGEVLVNVRGTLGGVAVVPYAMVGRNVSREVAVVPSNPAKIDPQYLAYWIGGQSSQAWLSRMKTGAAYVGINIEDLRTLPVPLPSLSYQRVLVDRVNHMLSEAEELSNIFSSKLIALAELKRSMLARAFSGELTANRQASAKPANDNVFDTPEQVANVLAFVQWRHEVARREKTFGHVKAQKALQLVESVGGVELGRTPVKAKAGPNDFPHMLKAEDWARDCGFFEFVKRPEGGYDFLKLANHAKMLTAAKVALRPIEDAVKKIADLLLPLDFKEAEVLATVHAAWNNLILDGCAATDNAILYEARENWHPKKSDIPEAKFHAAIRLIREKDIVPDGRAKRVPHEQMPLPL